MNIKNECSYNYFIYYSDCNYPDESPYNPEEKYPEYPFKFNNNKQHNKNDVYKMIRELFVNSSMDMENYEEAEELCRREPLVTEGFAAYKLKALQVADRENNYLL